ncbi:hypothetical protein M413DRAFT_12147 [Hebeloma cylindrosporum]|uniref:F-box domain-containing protein n=1 Tax=Hebeloma cylindrosporum TaxID=76867 RepID=A0A0C2XPN0_HEBCY|nr:hypothetical protein M413DRAFT_12147 [Hebeloma cylindrosporum h7]
MPSLRSFHALSLPSPLLANSGFHRLTLTELSLLGDLITPSDAALLLISCANIVKCALEVSLQHGSFNFNLAEPIELNRLESLTFCEKVGFPVSLHLPNLRNLSFGSYAHASIPRFDLPSTLDSGITTLILDLHTLTPELVLRSLSCASSLKCLTFSKWMGKTERIAYQLSGYEKETMVKVVEALTPTECDDLLVTTFCPNLEIFECEMFACFSDEALETMIVRRTSPKFQGSILRRVAVDFSRQPGDRHMTLDLWKSLENVVDESFELELEYLPESPVLISAWSGVGTEEMVPEWALDGISRN